MSNNANNLNTIPSTGIINTPVESQPTIQVEQPISQEPQKQPEPIKESQLDSTKWAQLTKKEAALVKERTAMKAEMEKFKQEQESFKSKMSEFDQYKKAWDMVNEIAELQKTDALAAMRKAGFKDEDFLNFIADQQKEPLSPAEEAKKIAQAELDKFRQEEMKKIEDANKKQEESRKKEEERVIANFKKDIGKSIQNEIEKFEFCNHYGEDAVETVYLTFSELLKDQEETPVGDDFNNLLAESIQMVEDYYEEQDKAMNSLKKRSSYLKPKEEPKQEQVIEKREEPSILESLGMKRSHERIESKQFVDNKNPVKTLTNNMRATTASMAPQELDPKMNKQRVIDKYSSLLKK